MEVPEMKVTKETLIGEILDFDVDTVQFFFNMGMYCLGCPHSRGESIEQACMAHGTDADKLIADINAFLEKKAANN
jgi:hybrid cluster-associated redox disulfide protein